MLPSVTSEYKSTTVVESFSSWPDIMSETYPHNGYSAVVYGISPGRLQSGFGWINRKLRLVQEGIRLFVLGRPPPTMLGPRCSLSRSESFSLCFSIHSKILNIKLKLNTKP